MTKESQGEDAMVSVEDLDQAIEELLTQGFRLEMIMPADEPHSAIVSRDDTQLRLEATRDLDLGRQVTSSGLLVTRESEESPWHRGRAGMEYRDLIPGRLGGSCVASHIRINEGGVTADYVHYHKVNFQMIFCRQGWARLVYEDQGPPFLFEEGDCVLQPPTIRHRVLETSSGFEVIEVSSPAVHETWVEHEMTLPNDDVVTGKLYGGQAFLLEKAQSAKWLETDRGIELRDMGIETATNGLASVRLVRYASGKTYCVTRSERSQILFALNGDCVLESPDVALAELKPGASVMIPPGSEATFHSLTPIELLHISIRTADRATPGLTAARWREGY